MGKVAEIAELRGEARRREAVTLEKEKINVLEDHVCSLPEICGESRWQTESFFLSLILSFLGTGVKGHRGREGQVMERVCRGVDIVPDHGILAA